MPATWPASARNDRQGAQAPYRKEGDVLALETAIIALADGQPKEAEKTLREVRDHFDYLEQKAPAKSPCR